MKHGMKLRGWRIQICHLIPDNVRGLVDVTIKPYPVAVHLYIVHNAVFRLECTSIID